MTETTTQPVYSADVSEITIPAKRQRKSFERGALNKLKSSIETHGQLQPGVCSKEGDKIVLIAGQRRFLACSELGLPFSYILVSEIPDPHKRKEMELHENVMRENLSFLEESEAVAELHKLYMEVYGTGPTRKGKVTGWSIEQSAAELGMSKTTLVEDLELVKYAKVLPEVAKAPTKTEAKKIIKRIKTGVIQSEALKQAVAKAQDSSCAAEKTGDEKTDAANALACAIQEFSSKVLCGTMEEHVVALAEAKPFNIVFFDPPWGVDYDEVGRLSGSKQAYSDKRKHFFQQLRGWLSLIHSVMAEDSHLYMKFGIVHHGFIYRMLKRTGFQVDGIPIIWMKKGQHRTMHPEVWPGRCYEPIAFARKGNKRLVQLGKPNLVVTPPPSPKMKDIHPSAMHPGLPKELLFRSAMPGDRVLDPMAGSCMTAVATESLKSTHMLDYVMIEKERTFCDLGVKNLIKGYERIVGEAALDNEESATDFRRMIPGSPEWQILWNEKPELRKEMIAFSEGGKG